MPSSSGVAFQRAPAEAMGQQDALMKDTYCTFEFPGQQAWPATLGKLCGWVVIPRPPPRDLRPHIPDSACLLFCHMYTHVPTYVYTYASDLFSHVFFLDAIENQESGSSSI